MAAVSSMILRSMRMIGEKARGETLDSNESVECLAELNTMIESWETQRLTCYSVTQESFSLTASTGTYTIGSGGTFNTARPYFLHVALHTNTWIALLQMALIWCITALMVTIPVLLYLTR